MRDTMTEKQMVAYMKKQGAFTSETPNRKSNHSIELLESTVDGFGGTTTANLQQLEMMGDTSLTISSNLPQKRSSIINQADVHS